MAAPRGISQPPTSFIGSQCQGIHHAPLNTYNTDKPNKEKNCTSNTHTKTAPNRSPEPVSLRARCSQPLSTNQTPHPTTKAGQQQEPLTDHPQHLGTHGLTAGNTHQRRCPAGLLSQSPIVCLAARHPQKSGTPKSLLSCTRTASTTEDSPSNESPGNS